MSDLVFVYGTLKRAYANNRLLNKSRFIGEGVTRGRFLLLDGLFPVMIRCDVRDVRDIEQVRGELFQVDSPDTWSALDRLEGVPSMYTREIIDVKCDANEKLIRAWTYLGGKSWSRDRRRCAVDNGTYVWDLEKKWENENA